MEPLYTVFVLKDPVEPLYVKYVGVTSQTLTKRLHDMMSACTKTYTSAYAAPSGVWLRSILENGQKPFAEVIYEGTDRETAHELYCNTINDNLDTGELTNTMNGRGAGIYKQPLEGRGPTGKWPNPETIHAQNSIRRKLRKP